MKLKLNSLQVTVGGALLLGLVAVLSGLFYVNISQWRQTEAQLRHVQAAVDAADNVYSHLLAAESAVRAYAISGSPAALAQFNAAGDNLDRAIDTFRRLEKEHKGTRRESMNEVIRLVAEREDLFQRSILAKRTGGAASRKLPGLTAAGTAATERIRKALADGQEAERSDMRALELEARSRNIQKNRLLAAVFLVLFIGVVITLGAVVYATRKRRLAEESLADEHARLQGVLDSASHLSVIATDLNGAITVFNRGAEKLLGYRAEEMLGKSPELIHLPEEIEEHARDLSRDLGKPVTGFDVFVAMARGGSFEHREWTYVRKDGSRVPVELVVTAMKDHEGRLTGFLGLGTDISYRKKAQLQMRKLSTAIKASPTSIVITDKDANIEYANPKFFALTGYSEEELLGKNPRLIASGSTQKSTYKEMWDTLTAGREWQGEFLNRKKSGELFWEHASISPVKDPRGNITNYVAVKLDITESKLAQKEIVKARDAAMELARLKSEFLANMSHEIRTPMNAIIGMGGLLLDTPLNDQQKDYVKTMTAAGEALLDIINDILDFSKIESGKLKIEKTDFDLAETVESTADLLAARAQAKGIELAYLVDPCVPQALCGDQGRLRQVLLNLIGNAVKFTDKGEVVITVACEKPSDETVTLRFSVKDTGIGIAPEAQRRLFQTFSQADASTTRKYGGTGLGLSISKKLVELMGGEIGVESEPGRGSTFWFKLPFDIRSCKPAPRPPRAEVAGVRTLIVDDNAANREILGRYLALWGLPFEAADSGETAIAKLQAAAQSDPFRLVVLDMQMPEMDGLMLARRLQAGKGFPAPVKIMMTSLGHTLAPAELAAAGIAACLPKPLRPNALLKAIGAALAGAAQPRQAPQPAEAQKPANRYFRVLVAEDNTVNQKVAVMQLAKLGYESDVAANGLEALQALKRRPYDLILMDCQMPEMDGYEATAEIRRLEQDQQRTPIVAMTANALQGDSEKALAAGMDGYLAKPVRLETLQEVLDRWDTSLDEAALKALKELAGPGNKAFFPDLVEAYVRDVPARLEAIRTAFGAGDAEALRAAAHALKGSSGNMGAIRMQKICRAIELAAKSGSAAGAEALLPVLEKEAPAAVEGLRKAAA